jgi:hypothetical protein
VRGGQRRAAVQGLSGVQAAADDQGGQRGGACFFFFNFRVVFFWWLWLVPCGVHLTSHALTTNTKKTQVKALCTAKRTRPGCADCLASFDANKTYGSCDLLAVWGEICVAEPSALSSLYFFACYACLFRERGLGKRQVLKTKVTLDNTPHI